MTAPRLEERFIHLGLGAAAEVLPPFTGMTWYADYEARAAADGMEGRLVSQYAFTTSWDAWEMHPHGAEVVICTAGALVLVQEFPDGHRERVALAAGDYAINPPGVWHTADIAEPASAIFITAGEGTQHRPR
jgi:mannose-6-phosphate isomerase-like protein (cupin superfamily)